MDEWDDERYEGQGYDLDLILRINNECNTSKEGGEDTGVMDETESRNSSKLKKRKRTEVAKGNILVQPAILGDGCPICLQDLENPVMIRKCYHVFCFECLNMWVRNLTRYHKSSPGKTSPTCPLCKCLFQEVYYDVVSSTDYRILKMDGRPMPNKITSTQDHGLRQRSLIYRQHMELVMINNIKVNIMDQLPIRSFHKDAAQWIDRELRACVGRDVDLTIFKTLIDSCMSTITTDFKQLQDLLKPFLHDDTSIFIRELAYFLHSPLNIQAYDQVVEYAIPLDPSHGVKELS